MRFDQQTIFLILQSHIRINSIMYSESIIEHLYKSFMYNSLCWHEFNERSYDSIDRRHEYRNFDELYVYVVQCT